MQAQTTVSGKASTRGKGIKDCNIMKKKTLIMLYSITLGSIYISHGIILYGMVSQYNCCLIIVLQSGRKFLQSVCAKK